MGKEFAIRLFFIIGCLLPLGILIMFGENKVTNISYSEKFSVKINSQSPYYVYFDKMPTISNNGNCIEGLVDNSKRIICSPFDIEGESK